MGNRYYQEGEGRAAGVRDLFAAVAPRYDLINDLQSLGLHRHWKRRLVRLAEVRVGEPALDLCCGTGDIAFELAAAGARVTGVDFSEPMLEIARRRAEKLSVNPVPGSKVSGGRTEASKAGTGGRDVVTDRPEMPSFEQGDALALRFDDASFDLVTVGYGLRNLRSLDEGLLEMARVTRPGGRLAVLDFAFPRNRAWRSAYQLHLRTLVPLLGRILCGDSATHAYILESLKRYPGPEEITQRIEAAGWQAVRCWNLLGGVMTIHRAELSVER